MRFIATRELGRLCKWLRILGYDAEYFLEDNPSSLIIAALREKRIILTRSARIGQPRGVRIVRLKSDFIKEQIRQALQDLALKPEKGAMFSRCIVCNQQLENIAKDKVGSKVPEYVFKTQEDFVTCPKCGRIYWQGTHWGKVARTLEEIGLIYC